MRRASLLLLIPAFAVGCGSSATPERTTTVATARPLALASEQDPRQAPDESEMRTVGLTGSLSTIEVRGALEPRAEEFGRCFFEHGRRLRTLGGRMALDFHVAADGTVETVRATDSTVGHRAVERCILRVAAETRFPRPHGGPADFSWPLELDPPEHVRHPITWDPTLVDGIVRRRASRLLRRCLPDGTDGAFQITAYVSRRGRVVAAGAIALTADLAEDEPLDCVAREVRRWRMPRHRDHQAKVTFEIR